MVYNGKVLDEFSGASGPRYISLVGKTFGNLKVICRAPNKKDSTMFWCECDCGDIGKYHSTHLQRTTTKCSTCSKIETIKSTFKGYGDIPLTYWNDLKRGAAGEKSNRKSRRKLTFNISIKDAWELFLLTRKTNHLSGRY